jgi:hypothetical protein
MKATLADYFDDSVSPTHKPQKPIKNPITGPQCKPDTDIKLWLTSNAPRDWQELKDLRYSLYHRCSRAGFKIKRHSKNYKDLFTLTGRTSALQIVSNKARRFLLRQLRILAKEQEWVSSGKVRIHPLVGRYF